MENEKLIQKIEKMKDKFELVEKFANKIPVCADYIIDNEIVEYEHNKIGDKYKSIWFTWGLNRGIYDNKSRTVTNCELDYDGKTLTNIYINTINIYDRSDSYGLEKLADNIFFYDKMNSTFYATDDELEPLLEALNDWYIEAKELACEDNKKDKLEKLEKEKQRIIDSCK